MRISNIPVIPTRRKWYLCEHCGKKLLIYDDAAKSEGIYIRCKGCGREIEIRI